MKTIFCNSFVSLTVILSCIHRLLLTFPGDYSTIQAAIDAANNRDIVLVANGTYLENIDFKEKPSQLPATLLTMEIHLTSNEYNY